MNNNIWIWFFFRLQGRIRRVEYLLGLLFLICLEVVLLGIKGSGGILSFIVFWANCAIIVKRVHDLGHSGLYVLAVWCAVFLAVAVFVATGFQAALFAGVAIGFAFNIWLLAARGQAHDNRFGPPPAVSGAVS